tara:strand:- start:1891 stop:3081 length:1191 start_codon:yes stop_codon:yes gene_type:complete
MGYKRFSPNDLVHNVVVTHPEAEFLVHSGKVYYQKERSIDGNFLNKIKHIPSGCISLFELNINRPSDSLIYPFIEKSSTRESFKSISASDFDDSTIFPYGSQLKGTYPKKATINRIFTPAGVEIATELEVPHANRKYVRTLKNIINTQNEIAANITYDSVATSAVNMICVPGIFYGSKIKKGSVELKCFIEGVLKGTASDKYSDGRLIQTYINGATTEDEIGLILYNQGLILITSDNILDPSCQEYYSSKTVTSKPTWLNFGTGLPEVGTETEYTAPVKASYQIGFSGVNKIPTLTMFAYSKLGEDNYSNNPTFLDGGIPSHSVYNNENYIQKKRKIKKINKSEYSDHEADFESTTYISKIGIYDKHKNLLAIATLANPVKKNEKRDYMFKIGIDF